MRFIFNDVYVIVTTTTNDINVNDVRANKPTAANRRSDFYSNVKSLSVQQWYCRWYEPLAGVK